MIQADCIIRFKEIKFVLYDICSTFYVLISYQHASLSQNISISGIKQTFMCGLSTHCVCEANINSSNARPRIANTRDASAVG